MNAVAPLALFKIKEMKYKIETWKIGDLIKLFEADKLNLSPSYQRNEIWPLKAKQNLINSILENYPIPNLFLYVGKGKYDVVDGQQRIRSIAGFYKKIFPDLNNKLYSFKSHPNFKKYEIAVIIITHLSKAETLELFYSLVNSTGLKLNRPELNKSKYFETRFLALLEKASDLKSFKNLDIFSESSINRMNDVDFIGELFALIKYGITEKKDSVDKLFEIDIDETEFNELLLKFKKILDILLKFDGVYPISNTRFRQKNDFYTLFGFINDNISLGEKPLEYIYKTLLLIENSISPTNDDCPVFKEYAYNCVTQSNSKNAREQRLRFYHKLFLNRTKKISLEQKQVLIFFSLKVKDVISLDNLLFIDAKKIQKIVREPAIF